jgi:hypothetical protein
MSSPSAGTDPHVAGPPFRRLLAATISRQPYKVMLLWGIAAGLLGAAALLAITPIHWPVMPSQVEGLRASLAVLRHGGPLLLGHHGTTGTPYAIGTEEVGLYIYFPLLSRILGLADPTTAIRYCYVTLFGLSAAAYPLIFYRLTRSLLGGFVAPLALLACIRSFAFNDVYWIPAWAALTLLPLVYLLARDWPRLGLLALVGISFTAGLLSSVRAGSGLAIAIAAAMVLVLRRWRWWRVAPALALLTVAYISIGAFVFPAVRAHRDHRIGTHNAAILEREQSRPHVWHTVYIGLGYLPNPEHIRYSDGVAIARVEHDAPGTPYLSSRYNTVLRKAFFSAVDDDPLRAIKQYAAKLLVTTADVAPYLLIVLITMPAMLLLGDPERQMRRRWVLLTLPSIVGTFLPPMIAIPGESYEEGLYGVIGLMGILGICWSIGRLEGASGRQGALHSMFAGLRSSWGTAGHAVGEPYRQSIRIGSILLVVLTVLVVGAAFVRRSAERWQGHSSGVLIAGASIDWDVGVPEPTTCPPSACDAIAFI